MKYRLGLVLLHLLSLVCLLHLCSPNEHEQLFSKWQDLASKYNVPNLVETFIASPDSTVTVIGGCPLTGIDRIIAYVEKKRLNFIHLGPVAWNLSTHNEPPSSSSSRSSRLGLGLGLLEWG